MPRWIAFDDETAEAVMSRFRRGAAEIREGDPLDAALDLGQPSLIILPSNVPGRVLVARCTPKASEPRLTPEKPALPMEIASDRKPPVQPPAQAQPRKWWRRRSA